MDSDSAVLWYYAENGQQKGPVDEGAFADLVRRGVVTPSTKVWKSGMAAWQPYGAVAGGAAADGRNAMCAYCGRLFPPDELADFNGTRVCAACKPQFVQQYKENAEATGRLGMRYAGFWIRVGAKILDNIICTMIVYAVTFPLGIVIGFAAKNSNEVTVAGAQVFSALFSLVVQCAYNVIPLVKWGATPGKMACGLKVVRGDGSQLTYGRAIGRLFANILSGMFCGIGYLMVAFDEKERKALHDSICDTRVIYKN